MWYEEISHDESVYLVSMWNALFIYLGVSISVLSLCLDARETVRSCKGVKCAMIALFRSKQSSHWWHVVYPFISIVFSAFWMIIALVSHVSRVANFFAHFTTFSLSLITRLVHMIRREDMIRISYPSSICCLVHQQEKVSLTCFQSYLIEPL